PDTGPDARPGSAPALDVRAERGDAYLPRLLRAADAAGIAVDTAQVRRPTLDDVFLALTGRSLREAGATTAAEAHPTERTAA
ncbi:MAG: ABC transporter, partial [Cellulosimicrobium funkei]